MFEKTVKENKLELQRTYSRILERLSYDQRFRNHSKKTRARQRQADRNVKTIAGRLKQDVEEKSGVKIFDYQNTLNLFKRVLAQKKDDKDKIYLLHDSEVRLH